MVIGLTLLVIGLGVLVAGAELLVRFASQLALAARLSPLVVGLTVVAYGTSTPELVVSISTALRGQAELALGNVVGSNTFNVLFILGLSALFGPLSVKWQIIRIDLAIMLAVSVWVFVAALDGQLSLFDGWLFLVGIVGYTGWSLWTARRQASESADTETQETAGDNPNVASQYSVLVPALGIVSGLGLLIAGSESFVRGATGIAESMQISQKVIGLTILAAGTSLPELATSVVAAYRGQRDIAVGNVVGSNIFNLLAVLGASCVLSPEAGMPVHASYLLLDFPVMLAAAAICIPVFVTGRTISRMEGGLMLAAYVAYTGWLIHSS
jgi:cation:H+ antiporter